MNLLMKGVYMKKILGSLLLLSLSLWAESVYHWDVSLSKSTLYLNEATTLSMKCTFEKEGKHDDVEFVPPKDSGFDFKLLSEKRHFEGERQVLRYEYLIFASKVGDLTLNLEPIMLFTSQSAIDNVIIGRDNVNDLEVQKAKAKIAPLQITVKPTGSKLTGTLRVEVENDLKDVSAYEPAHLEIKIIGEGNLQALKPIVFEIEGVQVFSDDPETSFTLSPVGYSGEWVQRFAFVGKKNFTIPSLEIKYFDVTRQSEQSLQIKAVEVKVKSDGIKREELIDKVDSPSSKIDFMAYLDYLYFLLTFIAGFIVAKLFKLPERTPSFKKGEKIKKSKSAKELLEVLMACDKNLFSNEIEALEAMVYKQDKGSLSSLKASALKRLA